jgi:hypothetical protein
MGRSRARHTTQLDLMRPEFSRMIDNARPAMALTPTQEVIGKNETFLEWCQRLAADGLKVDGKPFQLDDRPALRWVYEQIPSTVDEAYRLILVMQKSAQVGFTVMEILAVLYLSLKFDAGAVGMFMPDQQLAELKSSERFMPIVRSTSEVHALMRHPVTGRLDEGSTARRRLGGSLFVYLWTSGRTTTESIPMDILSLDEVQGMTLEQTEKVYERLSASPLRFMMMGSTANWPDADINYWYRRGSQHRFRTRCPTCSGMTPLDDYFPSCIRREDDGQSHYVCPDGHRIDDPQQGAWVADHPELDPPVDPSTPAAQRPLRIRSIHFPQMLSPTISPGEILDAFNTAKDLKNFYNRKLGKPFLDPLQTPVTMAHLNACVEAGRAAGVIWKPRAHGAFMGIDQMGQFNVVWIKERRPDGRQQLVHVEEIYSDDPFERCSELMEQYGVLIAVVELNPNYNDAKRFAHRFPGRVFICDSFGRLDQDMIRWGDTPRLDASDRRTDKDARDRHTLQMDQYKCMQWAFSRFVSTECLMPDPLGLVQEVIDKGAKHTAAVLPRAFVHFTKTALVAERDEEGGTNKFKRVVRKIGIDPHHSYANMLCDVAMARVYNTATFILPDPIAGAGDQSEPLGMPGLPTEVVALIDQISLKGEVCGRCASYQFDAEGQPVMPSATCSMRGFITTAADPGCEMFTGRT